MKFIDLFCGLGGFRLAFENAGGKCVFSSDNDKYVCETYYNNFGVNPFSDITQVESNQIPDFDILCAGFPCQPFSIGGLRKGFNDTRGTLFFHVERIIRDKRPKVFILENVKGLTNHDNGNTLNVILNKLSKKINGEINQEKYDDCLDYHVYFKVLNSKDFGLPQNRERIYIIGFDKDIKFEFPNPFSKKITLEDIIEENVEYITATEVAKLNIKTHLINHKQYEKIKDFKYLLAYEIRKSKCTFKFDGFSPTLTAKMGTGGNNIPILVNMNYRKLSVKDCLKIQGFPNTYKIKYNNQQSYKQIGNSVSVPVISLLAKKIIESI